MPRSVNHVASKEEQEFSKRQRDIMVPVKMFGQLQKILTRKV